MQFNETDKQLYDRRKFLHGVKEFETIACMDKELKDPIAFIAEKLECEEDVFEWDVTEQTLTFYLPSSEQEHV